MALNIALKVNDLDNVATVFVNGIEANDQVEVRDSKGNRYPITVSGPIPYGHKLAIDDIAVNSLIIKYGEEIGICSKPIKKGDHVHVHNLDSMRGRGDL
ncbi:MAG: UxaA family hydrolase [Clostridiales bacterium]|nr:UxaA family hydrolase [Clostridiales bacterium]